MPSIDLALALLALSGRAIWVLLIFLRESRSPVMGEERSREGGIKLENYFHLFLAIPV